MSIKRYVKKLLIIYSLFQENRIQFALLRVGATKSLFCGVNRLWKDSLAAVNPSLEFKVYIATMEENRKNGTQNLPEGYYWSYIYKNYPNGCLTEKNYFDGERRVYEEEWKKPQWEVSDSVKIILGYECFNRYAMSRFINRVDS